MEVGWVAARSRRLAWDTPLPAMSKAVMEPSVSVTPAALARLKRPVPVMVMLAVGFNCPPKPFSLTVALLITKSPGTAR